MNVARPQQTIRRSAEVTGVSFLAGLDVRLTFRPAGIDHGVVFARTDLPGTPTVPAHVVWTVPRQRRTTLQRGEAVVEMVEHVLAALAGLRIDNCLVEIDGPETPGCDGSSRDFAEALAEAGVVAQEAPRACLVIDRPVVVREGDALLAAYPGTDPERLVLSYQLDYGDRSPITRQGYFAPLDPATFRAELAPARTFLLEAEAHALRQAGIGLRTSESDLLIFGPSGVIGNELRFADEPSRHKLLDLVGDLALTGVDLVGHIVAHRSGHSLNAALARKLLEMPAGATEGSTSPAASAPVSTPTSDPAPARRRAVAAPSAGAPVLPLESNDILRALPHRYPFLLVDRIVELEPGVRAVGVKNVTYNEPFFQGHWPGRPIMPGVLIIEAMAQTAGVLIAQSGATHRYALLVSVDGVKFRRPVVPGDQLRLAIDGVRTTGRATQVRATARVGDRVAAEGRIRFIAIDAERERSDGIA